VRLFPPFAPPPASRPSSDGGYQGNAITMSHVVTFTALVRAARRFFPPGSAAEIWEALRPGLADPASSDAMHAAGWLALFTPTTHIGWDDGCDWGALVASWASLLRAVPDCRFWSALWLCTLARCAKHDLRGRVDWAACAPEALQLTLNALELPIGGSGGSPPWSRRTPRDAALLFSAEVRGRGRSGAKLLVYTLPAEAGAGEGALRMLDVLVECTEHYAHPSNSGPWSASIAVLLRSATSYLAKRVTEEARWAAAAAGQPRRAPLSQAAQAALAARLLRLASRAQFAKSDALARAAAYTIATLAYLAPASALPLALTRFEAALQSATATHQLVAAMDTLTLCVRPLLAAPRAALAAAAAAARADGGEAAMDEDGPPATAEQLLSGALYAVLPGLDANDPPKTLSTLRFFTGVLSSLPGVLGEAGSTDERGAPPPLAAAGMDWAAWTDEALSRLLHLLSSLEAGGGGGDGAGGGASHGADGATFLLYGNSQFRPFVELLFARLSPPLREAAANRLARLAIEAALPGVSYELGILLNAAAWHLPPRGAAAALLLPLAEALGVELDAIHPGSLSPAAETLLRARAARLTATLHCSGGAVALCRPQLEALLARLWSAARAAQSQPLWDVAGALLTAALSALVAPFDVDQYMPEQAAAAGAEEEGEGWVPSRVAAWMPVLPDGLGAGAPPAASGPPPRWHCPGAEELAMVAALLETYAEAPAAALSLAASAAAATPPKEALRTLLLQLGAALSGVQSALPDDDDDMGEATSADGAPFGLYSHAACGGTRPVGRPGARGRICAGLAAAATLLRPDDSDGFGALLHAAELSLCRGSTEHGEQGATGAAWRGDAASLSQPRCSDGSLMGADAGPEPGGRLARRRRRRPRWVAVESAFVTLLWRTGQCAYFRTGRPNEDAAAPPASSAYTRLLSAVVRLAMHPYKAVRSEAAPLVESALKRCPALRGVVFAPFLDALATGASGAAGEGEEAALGAAAMLSGRTCSRLAAADPQHAACLLRALLGSARHQGLRAQSAVHDLFLVLAVRFSRVSLGGCGDVMPAPLAALRAELLASASAAQRDGGGAPTHWRYSLMSHALVAFMARPGRERADGTASLASFFLSAVARSDLAPLRSLAAAALLSLYRAAAAAEAGGAGAAESGADAARAALAAALEGGGAAQLVKQLALSHVSPDGGGGGGGEGADGEGGGGRGGRMGFTRSPFEGGHGSADVLWRAVAACTTPRDFPDSKYGDAAPGGNFNEVNARLFAAFVAAQPALLPPALRAPLEAAHAAGDRGSRAVVAEAVSGLFAACGPDGAAREALSDWAAPLFLRGALEAPAEARGDWAAAVMFAASGGAPGRAALLQLLCAPLAAGARAGWQARRLLLLRCALAQAAQAAKAGGGEDAAAVAAALAEALRECTALRAAPLRAVREEAAALAAVLMAMAAADGGGGGGEDVERLFSAAGARARAAQAAYAAALAQPATEFASGLEAEAAAAAAKVLSVKPPASGEAEGEAAAASVPEVAWLESALLWAVCVVRMGDGAALAGPLLHLLPSLLRVQTTPDVDFDHVAKRALAYYKYAQLPAAALPAACAVLAAAARGDDGDSSWHRRAAALVLLSPVSFRHALLLTRADGEAVRAAAVGRLSDPRLEVRQLAAQTLAGLLMGPAHAAAPELRARFLAAAAAPPRKPGEAAEGAAEAHARVLGLAACILACPYDCPPWMPPMVVALVRAGRGSAPQPVRATVTATFAEFKRTHTDSWAATKAAFGEEAWAAASDGIAPSYFA